MKRALLKSGPKTLVRSALALILGCCGLFIYSLVLQIYTDHKSLMSTNTELKQDLANRAGDIGRLQQQLNAPKPVAAYVYRNEMTIAQTVSVMKELSKVFRADTLTPPIVVITAPPAESNFKEDFYQLVVAACQQRPPKPRPQPHPRGAFDAPIVENIGCMIEPVPDPRIEVDTHIPKPIYSGVVIHTDQSFSMAGEMLRNALGYGCFAVRKSQNMPAAITRLSPGTGPLIWFELGSGSPWNTKGPCPRK